MLSDEDMREMRIFLLSGNTFSGSRSMELLDEIARLRAMVEAAESNAKLHFEAAEEMRSEVERLRAALAAKTLRAETVDMLRSAAKEDIASRGPSHLSPRMSAALTDLSRAYPEEV